MWYNVIMKGVLMKYNLLQQAFGFNEIKNIKEYQNYNLIKNKTEKGLP